MTDGETPATPTDPGTVLVQMMQRQPEQHNEQMRLMQEQMAADRAAEEKRQADMERESKAYATKKAKGIIGARSLFARAGGRGFFG